jgi:hypothetical protein
MEPVTVGGISSQAVSAVIAAAKKNNSFFIVALLDCWIVGLLCDETRNEGNDPTIKK